MKISIVTLFPKMIESFINESIVKRAQEKKLVEIELVDLRKFTKDKYGTVDDRPYGGGAGMVLKVDILNEAINKVKGEKVVLLSARGKPYNQKKAKEYSKLDHLVLIAGHYEGVDERVIDYIDEEISMGDFVMTGGEIAASAIIDSVARLIPGVLKKEESTQLESFFAVPIEELIAAVGENKSLLSIKKKGIKVVQLLEYPHYTRPEEYQRKKVPEVLLKGNHKEIERWRIRMAYEETLKRRPDLLISAIN